MFTARTRWKTSQNRLAQALEKRRAEGLSVVDLTESNPTRCGFLYDTKLILGALSSPRSMKYEPDPLGLAQARKAVCDYYAERNITAPPARVLLTTGSSEAYSFLFRLLAETGDEILVPAPSYPLLDLLADINDVRLVRYPLVYDHGWRLDQDGMVSALTPRTRAIVVVSPNNPTGSFLKSDELSGFVELARRHDLALIADEVFSDFAWSPVADRATSLASVDECLTFTLNGLSKLAALPQMKLGWIVTNGPEGLVSKAVARLEIIADTYLSVATPVQQAAEEFLHGARLLREQVLDRVRQNLAHLDRALGRGSACSRLVAEGGWYAVLRVPGVQTDEDWAVELLEQDGVYVHPGHLFDFESGSHLVVSLIPPKNVFQLGLRTLLDRVQRRIGRA